jgi:DNA-directed RNA polymerase subunit RPC12/RpoP
MTYVCPSCGKKVTSIAKFVTCPACGHKVVKKERQPVAKKTQTE